MKRLLPEEYRAKIIASIIVVAAGVGIFMVSQRLGAIAGFINYKKILKDKILFQGWKAFFKLGGINGAFIV